MCWLDKYNVTTGRYLCFIPEINLISLETIRYKILYPIKHGHQNPQNIQKYTYKYYKTMCKFKFLKEVLTKLGRQERMGWVVRKSGSTCAALHCDLAVESISSRLFSELVLYPVLINRVWKKWGFVSSKPRLQECFQLSICSVGT